MRNLFSTSSVSIGERRLLFMTPPSGPDRAPTPEADKLKDITLRTKEVILSPNELILVETAKRIGSAGEDADKARPVFNKILQAEFDHLKTQGKTDEEAMLSIDQLVIAAGFKFVRIGMTDGKINVAYEVTSSSSPDKPKKVFDEVKSDPVYLEMKTGMQPDIAAAMEAVLQKMDTDSGLIQDLRNFAEAYRGLNPNEKKSVFLPALLPASSEKLKIAHGFLHTPKMNELSKAIQAEMKNPSKPEDPVEKEKHDSEVIKKAQDMLVSAKEGLSKAKTDDEKLYVRESSLGKLQMLGIDVTNEDGLLDGSEKPRIAKYTEKWEEPMNKFMGLMRLGGAIMNKLKAVKSGSQKKEAEKKPEASIVIPTVGPPAPKPEVLKAQRREKLKKEIADQQKMGDPEMSEVKKIDELTKQKKSEKDTKKEEKDSAERELVAEKAKKPVDPKLVEAAQKKVDVSTKDLQILEDDLKELDEIRKETVKNSREKEQEKTKVREEFKNDGLNAFRDAMGTEPESHGSNEWTVPTDSTWTQTRYMRFTTKWEISASYGGWYEPGKNSPAEVNSGPNADKIKKLFSRLKGINEEMQNAAS